MTFNNKVSSDSIIVFQLLRRKFDRLAVYILFGLLALVPKFVSAQSTLNVPAGFPSIQGAIAAAQTGDTVLVAPGTYVENIDFIGKEITVRSSSGPEVTTIDGGQIAVVVAFHTNEDTGAILEGFTIENGKDAGSGNTGSGGISIINASPKLLNNIIKNNSGCFGNGIAIRGGAPLIQGNTISNNTQTTCSAGVGGGGIFLSSRDSAQIIGNTISNNSSASGGGISMNSAGTPVIKNNYISGNVASQGGGIYMVNDSNPVIVQNILVSNRAFQQGGGLYAVTAQLSIIGNTIADNDAPQASGLYANVSNPTAIANNLIVARLGQAAVYFNTSSTQFPQVFVFNDVYSNGGNLYEGNQADQTGLHGNVSFDPKFANPPAGNYHLDSDSPAIDAGNNQIANTPSNDFDGNSRIAGTQPVIDLGAFEYQGSTTLSVSPSSLLFSNQLVGTDSSPQQLTVSNTGTRTLHVKPISTPDGVTETDNCGTPIGIPAGGFCTVNVIFAPSHPGQYNTVLSVLGSNVTTPAQNVIISGYSTSPLRSTNPTSLNFPLRTLFTTSSAQQVIVQNTGDASLHFSSIVTAGDFSQSNNCSVLQPGQPCTISVSFTPTATGLRTGQLTIVDDAFGGPVSLPLTGTSSGPEIAFSSSALNFPQTAIGMASAPQTLTLTNTGTDLLTISNIQHNGDFSFSGQCAVIAPSAQCTLSVVFTPTLIGQRKGSLSFTDNAAASPQIVSLLGFGPAASQIRFAPARRSMVGSNPIGLVTGDLNGDGKADVITINMDDKNISVLLGNGDGSFQPAVPYALGNLGTSWPIGIDIGDFDRDHKLDVVVATARNGTSGGDALLLLGNGDGTLQTPASFSTSTSPLGLKAEDINNDGKLDLLIPGNGSARFLLGNGAGGFGSPQLLQNPPGVFNLVPTALASADLNGDGKPEIIAGTFGSSGLGGTVWVYINDGTGNFSTPISYLLNFGSNGGCNSIFATDLDGDQNVDVICALTSGSAIKIFYGNGDGTLRSPATNQFTYGGTSPVQFVLEDFNGDGIRDLAVADFNGTTLSTLIDNMGVTTVPGVQGGSFSISVLQFDPGEKARGIATADFNGDGLPDLVTASSTTNEISLLLNGAMMNVNLSATPSPAAPNQQVALSATVNAITGNTTIPTGTLTFFDGPTTLGTVTLNNSGTAVLNTSFADSKATFHPLMALYSGDSHFPGSSSQRFSLGVGVASTISLTALPTSASVGDPITFTATVSAPGTTPTGQVTLKLGGTVTVGVMTLTSGQAVFNISNLPYGTNTITAMFTPNTNSQILLASSASVNVEILGANTTTSLSLPNMAVYGESVNLAAVVSGVGSTPTGTVTFSDGATSLGTVPLANGTATFNVPKFSAGSHTITATYNGDGSFSASSSSGQIQVSKAVTSTSLGSNMLSGGSTVALMATVTSSIEPPLGAVIFKDGNTEIGTSTVGGSGIATLQTGTLTVGEHSFTANYSGTANFAGSISNSISVTILNPTPIVQSLSPFSVKQNSAAFTLGVNGTGFVNGATVNWNGSPRATTFVNSTRLNASILASDLTASGTASITVSNPAPTAASSAVEMFSLDTASQSSVTLGSTNVVVTAGQTTTVAVEMTGFTGSVTATCLNLPVGATCSYNTTTNQLSVQTSPSTAKGSYTITAVFSGNVVAAQRGLGFSTMLALIGTPLGFVIIGIPRRRKIVLLVGSFILLLMMLSCGGGSMSNAGSSPTPPTTPSSQPAQASVAFTLVVQ